MISIDIWQKNLEAKEEENGKAMEEYAHNSNIVWLTRFEYYRGKEDALSEIYNQLKEEENGKAITNTKCGV